MKSFLAVNNRKTMVGILREKFAHLGLTYSIGGQISFDVFPKVVALCITLPKAYQWCLLCIWELGLNSCTDAARYTACPCAQLWLNHVDMLLWTLEVEPPCAGLGQDILPAVCREGV